MKKVIMCAIALITLFHGRLFAGEHVLTEWKINEIISGPQAKLEDLPGKVVMIQFWGYYCSDCVADLPELSKLDKRYSQKGLCIIGIHVRNGKTEYPKEEILKHVKKQKAEFTIAHSGNCPKDIKIPEIPRLFIFDREGKMVFDGRLDKEAKKLVEKLMTSADNKTTGVKK